MAGGAKAFEPEDEFRQFPDFLNLDLTRLRNDRSRICDLDIGAQLVRDFESTGKGFRVEQVEFFRHYP